MAGDVATRYDLGSNSLRFGFFGSWAPVTGRDFLFLIPIRGGPKNPPLHGIR